MDLTKKSPEEEVAPPPPPDRTFTEMYRGMRELDMFDLEEYIKKVRLGKADEDTASRSQVEGVSRRGPQSKIPDGVESPKE